MAWDLALGTAAITGLSFLSFVVGRWVGLKPATPKFAALAASLFTALAFAYLMSGKLFWARALPSASVIYWSNLMPALLSLTAGLASTSDLFSRWNRPATVASLVLLTAGYVMMPTLLPIIAPATTDPTSVWKHNLCLQSHGSTCAPAAAATLLRSASIDADETSMVRACLTSRYGTVPLGLFRGLAIASKNSPSKPRIASTNPDRWPELGQLPNVALITFEVPSIENADDDSSGLRPASLSRIFGPSEEGHAIVVLGKTDSGRWIIADPAFGRTVWTDECLKSRFSGDAIYLAR
jgi:hypothetical protein